jgi:hypothetical protein
MLPFDARRALADREALRQQLYNASDQGRNSHLDVED